MLNGDLKICAFHNFPYYFTCKDSPHKKQDREDLWVEINGFTDLICNGGFLHLTTDSSYFKINARDIVYIFYDNLGSNEEKKEKIQPIQDLKMASFKFSFYELLPEVVIEYPINLESSEKDEGINLKKEFDSKCQERQELFSFSTKEKILIVNRRFFGHLEAEVKS